MQRTALIKSSFESWQSVFTVRLVWQDLAFARPSSSGWRLPNDVDSMVAVRTGRLLLVFRLWLCQRDCVDDGDDGELGGIDPRHSQWSAARGLNFHCSVRGAAAGLS